MRKTIAVVACVLGAVVACGGGAPDTPAGACANIAQAACKRQAQCQGISDQAAINDCTQNLSAQLGCPTFTCAAGHYYSVNAYNQCVSDLGNEDCASAISGVSAGCPSICQ